MFLGPSSNSYRDPEPGEIRESGYALMDGTRGFAVRVHSCRLCADTLDVPWIPAVFEGTCEGCESALSPVDFD